MTAMLILYASTSGSTRLLVHSVAAELGDANVECYDIKTLDRAHSFASQDLVVLATPTYGTGDWHNAWSEKGEKLMDHCPADARVAVLGLGDSRSHKKSFAGGIGKLAGLARSKAARLVGAVPLDGYDFEASPAVEDGRFPGLVVEYRRNRIIATAKAVAWVRGILSFAN